MSEKVTCKSCKHSKFDWTNPFGWGTSYAYKCKKSIKPKDTEWDPVTGKETVIKEHLESCPSMRSRHGGDCGVDGKLWEPKHKNGLFTYIKRT